MGSEPDQDDETRRFTRLEAGIFSWQGLRERYIEAARATTVALAGAEPSSVVATQGHAITVTDLASTLAVEATLHHLDLVARLPAAPTPPSGAGLAEVRRVVTSLLDRELRGWSDDRLALVTTGRAEPTAAELADLDGATIPAFT